MSQKLPKNIEPFFAQGTKTTRGNVLIVPNYNGGLIQFKKHIRFFTGLGYDCFFLTLSHNRFPQFPPLSLNSELKYGLRHLWTDEIENALTYLQGSTVVVSHSFPSSAALAAIANRFGADITAWICDGGPFLQLVKCAWNVLKFGLPVNNILLRASVFMASPVVLGTFDYEKDLKADLKRLPAGFPVLSIRGWKDNVVPPGAIDQVFEGQTHLRYEILALPEGGHLDGLHKHAEHYKLRVTQFLEPLSNGQSLHSGN